MTRWRVPKSGAGDTSTGGILGGAVDGPRRVAAVYADVDARVGMTVTHRGSGYTGTLRKITSREVEIAGTTGLVRIFPLEPGAFSVDRVPCNLVRRTVAPPQAPVRTASGSVAVRDAKPRVARAARIVVEGVHDAELIERVWGDDLRIEGVVVERLDGINNLESFVADFRPATNRKLGVLVDHLVAGSKEARIASRVSGPSVLVAGTPYIDVWAAVRPKVIGIDAWPDVPRGTEWKAGVCEELGVGDPRAFWRKLLSSVHTLADLEVSVVNAVERLIDFVTVE